MEREQRRLPWGLALACAAGLVLLPGTARAHNPAAFVAAGSLIAVGVAVVSALLRWRIAAVWIDAPRARSLAPHLALAALDLALFLAACPLSHLVLGGVHTFALLGCAFALYLPFSIGASFLVLRRRSSRARALSCALGLGLVFPVLYAMSFMPGMLVLYPWFGG